MKAVTAALAEGEITPSEAGRIETSDIDRRLQELEDQTKAHAAAGTATAGQGWYSNGDFAADSL
jgi:hypothetical protein